MKIQIGFWCIADPIYWFYSLIKKTGRLDVRKFAEFIRKIVSEYGVNVLRVLPFLVRDPKTKKLIKWMFPLKGHNRLFLPFVFENGKYNLEKLNPIYFDNLKEMIKGCNRMNCAFQVVFTDRCHHRMPDSPWMLNHQNTGSFSWYDWSKPYIGNYVSMVLDTVKKAEDELKLEVSELYPNGIKLQILFELENEPEHPDFYEHGANIMYELKKRGYNKNQIEWGLAVWTPEMKKVLDEKTNKLELIKTRIFEEFKGYLRKWDKEKLYDNPDGDNPFMLTSHNFGTYQKQLDEILLAIPHTFIYKFSNDGLDIKPPKEVWYDLMLPIFQKMKDKQRGDYALNTWMFEALYQGFINGESMFGDHLDGIFGLSQAFFKVYGYWPPNIGKFPETIYPPNTEEETEEEDMKEIEELKKTVEGLLDTINKKQNLIDTLYSQFRWKFFGGFKKKFPFVNLAIWTLAKKEWKGVLLGGLSLWLFTLIVKLFKLIF